MEYSCHIENIYCLKMLQYVSVKATLVRTDCLKFSFSANWIKLQGKLDQIDGGLVKTVYGTDSNENVYRVKNMLYPIPDTRLSHVSPGQGGIWGVNAQEQIIFSHPKKPSQVVSGSLIQVDSGPAGVVYGVNRNHKIYYRDGILPGNS